MWQYSNYSKVDENVRRHFPFKNPRPDQLETISEIVEAISKGYKYIVLEAGTGTGKSAIAYTLSSLYESSYILTVTKQLQEQYMNDFNNLKLVKGRKNFTCRKDLNHTCDEGKCILEGYSCDNSKENCDYYLQKYSALDFKSVISNYHYMFLELNYVGDFTNRQLLICDEAHNLENTLMSQLKLEFSVDDLDSYLNFKVGDEILYELDNGDFDVWLQFIGEIRDDYSRELDKIKDVKKPHLIEKISFIKKQISDCSRFVENISHDPYSWVFDYNRDYQIIEFKPLKIDNYAKNTLFKYADVCIFMSATILDYKFFSKCLGIGEDEIYAIRRKSPFDMKRNPVESFDGINMSHRTISKDAPKTIGIIRDILNKHKGEKGMIHTVSGTCKDYLINCLDEPRLIEHNTQNRTEQLEKFKDSADPLVLISPSMNEGVDLPGDLCRFQILYKLPYPDLADKQIRLRANADEDWYDYKTSLALIQAYGRGMRFEDDYCRTYFIDSRIRDFVKSDKFIPEDFRNQVLNI
jgi:Rad3-related DNA helicase